MPDWDTAEQDLLRLLSQVRQVKALREHEHLPEKEDVPWLIISELFKKQNEAG